MTGFSAEWLALREPVDHRSRDAGLARSVADRFAGRDHLAVVDLGCGGGSNLRAAAPLLGVARQSWTLVDYDEALLDAARRTLAAWADASEEAGEELLLRAGAVEISVDFRRVDLAADLERPLDWGPDLVTAAALFDLASAAWIERFVQALARRRLPLHATLIYDGVERWRPPHPLDSAMLKAFHAHQARDKGFGPAAGPQAASVMAQAFERSGYRVASALTPWRLGPEDADLIAALADGAAGAVMETGRVAAPEVKIWRQARRAAQACEIGHVDLFATPA